MMGNKKKSRSQISLTEGTSSNEQPETENGNTSKIGKKRKPLSQISLTSSANKHPRIENEESPKMRAGTISYMSLKNFMCHSWLEVNFNSNITVVTGNNGSGKSAILTALVVGLGGKAGLTNRGNSIKGFIKAGTKSGSIEIHLNNVGLYAYKPQVYGRKIIVIRKLNVSGASSYQIKSENGPLISTRTQELKNVTTGLEIQIDNPVCILNQDVSRSFLHSNDPRQKFSLFLKATRLDKLAEQYEKTKENLRHAQNVFEEKKAVFEKQKEEYKKLQRLIKGRDMIKEMKSQKLELRTEMFWAKVRDTEVELEKKREELQEVQNELDKVTEQNRDKLQMAKGVREKIRELQNQISEITEAVNVQKLPQNDIKQYLAELSRSYNEAKIKMNQVQVATESKSNDLTSLQQLIVDANQNLSKAEQEKIDRMEKLKVMQDGIKKHEERLETSRESLFQISNDLSNKENEELNMTRMIKDIEAKIRLEKSNLLAMQGANNGNPLLLYNANMLSIKQHIETNKRKFKHEPIGPIGHYIKLINKEWAVAIEGHLTPDLLCGFIVDNQADNKLLREIYAKASPATQLPLIITTKFIFKKYDVDKHMVQSPSDCLPLINAIYVENAVVFNCLVDQANVESILLIPSDVRAQELLSNRNRVPKSCSLGVTKRGDKYYPDPNYKTYGSQYHHAKYLQGDTQQLIIQIQANLDRYAQERLNECRRLKEFQEQIADQVAKKKEIEKVIHELNEAKAKVRQNLRYLRETAEPEVASIDSLQNELVELKNEIKKNKEKQASINADLTKIESEKQAKEDQLRKLRSATVQLEERVEPLKIQIADHEKQVREISMEDRFFEKKIREIKNKFKQVETDKEQIEISIRGTSAEAKSVGARPPNLRVVHEIAAEITSVNKEIALIESESNTYTDIDGTYATKSKIYQKNAPIINVMNEELNELSNSVNSRLNHYMKTENFFVSYIKYSFKKVLETRQFKGYVNLSIKDKTLDLVVMPQLGSQGATNTTNLSGGERSLTTVSFLYALWQCTCFPFYFLDEFDVFMDKLNRTKVFRILIEHAKSKSDLQHVFLTPQEISFLDPKEISIMKLQDPERIQK